VVRELTRLLAMVLVVVEVRLRLGLMEQHQQVVTVAQELLQLFQEFLLPMQGVVGVRLMVEPLDQVVQEAGAQAHKLRLLLYQELLIQVAAVAGLQALLGCYKLAVAGGSGIVIIRW
jgi:hypothetical protein